MYALPVSLNVRENPMKNHYISILKTGSGGSVILVAHLKRDHGHGEHDNKNHREGIFSS